ncbi:protein translocase subunit SecF [Sneathiella sp.]|uniref:protein translocase subunit SecF n=1 Tax=Sneathiella sp. TaxID=1964365 RepID=UPI002FE29BA6
MKKIKLIPDNTNVPFIRMRLIAFAISAVLILGSAGAFLTVGLNKGIDFEGGILMEVGLEKAPDLASMRSSLGNLGIGSVALQTFGRETDILIRAERQPGEAAAQEAAVEKIKQQLTADYGENVSLRRVEFVGPKVSGELIIVAVQAVILSMIGMLIYIWLRFEWQYSVAAIIGLLHDVIITVGMYTLTRIEFNLTSIAALLTIVGYSINDTVVIYDRIRENVRRYKKMPMAEMINLSLNETLSRTTMTGVTTLLALGALYFFGGEVIRGFAFAMIVGVVIGTYSSIFVCAPILLYFGVRHPADEDGTGKFAAAEQAEAKINKNS